MSEIKSSSSSEVFPLLSVEIIKADLIAATGSDQLTLDTNYWGDQYNVPSFEAVQGKRSAKKNMSLGIGNNRFSTHQRKTSLPIMLEGSSQCFIDAVGKMHGIFLRVDIYTSIIWACKHIFKKLEPGWVQEAWTKEPAIVSITAENYEIPLGGFSIGADDVFYKTLIPTLNGESFEPSYLSTVFIDQLKEAGMNHSKHKEIYQSVVMCQKSKKLAKTGVDGDKHEISKFLLVATEMLFLISKGDLDVNSTKHDSLVKWFIDFMSHLSDRDREKMCNSSVSLFQLWGYCSTLYRAQKGLNFNLDSDFLEIE
jgi:hypothetical protein